MPTVEELNSLLLKRDRAFWPALARQSQNATAFNELIFLSRLRKKALKAELSADPSSTRQLRVALVGATTLYPLSEFIEHMLAVAGSPSDTFLGDYNNYRSEILEDSSKLYQFKPNIVVIVPDEQSCKYIGKITDSRDVSFAEVTRISSDILQLCSIVNQRTTAEIVLCNFMPSPYFDLGASATKGLGSDWSFKKAVNTDLGNRAPNFVHICDTEFLAYRLGGLAARNETAWFESKQLYSPTLQVAIGKEIAHLIVSLKTASKKILVLDLDNTLWGGTVGDDGIEGIEIGDTSPRSEAFKAFQNYILDLTGRGILLGVCSKNNYETAIEPFKRHPEMVLRERHFVSFKANWESKADNLRTMAKELDLGLDSFVFVDDNPAEIEIVRQFAPEVTTILLSSNPADYVKQLQESRLFERLTITTEDLNRTEQYRQESQRKVLQSTTTDMAGYLQSLEMVGIINEFNSLDLPRIAQLINKSNQFNLTTKRRTESDLKRLMEDPNYLGFTMRLEDRFGDHGLITVIICDFSVQSVLRIDTWLMSCRVLKRQVEEEVLNEIVRLARSIQCTQIKGDFVPSAKNGMVSDLYPRMGFECVRELDDHSEFEYTVESFVPFPTHIAIRSRTYNNAHFSGRSNVKASNNI